MPFSPLPPSSPAGRPVNDLPGGAVLIVCGGGARHILGDGDLGLERIILDKGELEPPVANDGIHLEDPQAFALAIDRKDEIGRFVAGKRAVIAFAMLGGGAGAGTVPAIAECAHDAGCSFVSVIGVPYEPDRRYAAFESLSEIAKASDRMFVFDTLTIDRLHPNAKIHHALNMIASTVQMAIRAIASLVDGPFFSTFTKKAYTLAYTTSFYPSEAVARASEASLFEPDPEHGRCVVFVSSRFGTAELESISSTVAEKLGMIPDIVRRDDAEDTKVLTFLPVHGF